MITKLKCKECNKEFTTLNEKRRYCSDKCRLQRQNILLRLRMGVGFAFRKYTQTGKIMVSKKYGINYQEIIEHLKPFPEDITKHEIDHIRPLCSFNFVNKDMSINSEEIKKAFAPENHQWLSIQDNRKKQGKWEL